MNSLAQMKSDRAAISGNFPRSRERGFESLRLAIETNENSAGQVADILGSFIVHQNRIESFGFTVKAEVELATRLRANGNCKGKQYSKSKVF